MKNKSFTIALLGLLLAAVVTPRGWAAEQHGLQGRYFAADSKDRITFMIVLYRNRSFIEKLTADKPVAERVETLDFDWVKNPASRPAPSFMAQWHGSLISGVSGEHVFRIEASGAFRMVFDGRILMDMWHRNAPETQADSLPVLLEKGKPYAVIVEQLNKTPNKSTGSYLRLLWKTPGSEQFTVVPASTLRPELPATLSGAMRTETPSFQPSSGTIRRPTQLYITTTTPDALVRFTTDGSTPTLLHGDICTPGGVPLISEKYIGRAFKPGLADSGPVMADYKMGEVELKTGLKTFHTGNSLMDTVVNGDLQTVTRSVGIDHTVLKATIPGASTDNCWLAFSQIRPSRRWSG